MCLFVFVGESDEVRLRLLRLVKLFRLLRLIRRDVERVGYGMDLPWSNVKIVIFRCVICFLFLMLECGCFLDGLGLFALFGQCPLSC